MYVCVCSSQSSSYIYACHLYPLGTHEVLLASRLFLFKTTEPHAYPPPLPFRCAQVHGFSLLHLLLTLSLFVHTHTHTFILFLLFPVCRNKRVNSRKNTPSSKCKTVSQKLSNFFIQFKKQDNITIKFQFFFHQKFQQKNMFNISQCNFSFGHAIQQTR